MAKKKGTKELVGVWAFFIGLVLSIILAIFTTGIETWIVVVLGILGIIVGLLNVSDKEVTLFLIATIAFLMSFSAFSDVFMSILRWQPIANFFNLLAMFIAPAAAIVAIRAIIDITKRV